ncbi:MAG: alanine racemase, partial [Gammaproteobacteria bacterium]|nr:alanine racemase [Gammaproteobacteria bacterium]
QKILVLEGCFDSEEFEAALQHHLDLAIHQPEQLDILQAYQGAQRIDCWLKIDTGMHRLGFQPDLLGEILPRVKALKVVSDRLRLMTHFACADDPEDSATSDQLNCFRSATEGLTNEFCVANSAGILAWSESRLDWCRPGIMLYGASPMVGGRGVDFELQPVMTLTSKLIAINHYSVGDTIGYSRSWSCPESMAVGTVAIGYGDGYPRHAPAGTPLLLNGRRVPLVGRVSMDMINIDLRTQPEAELGDSVTLWGEGLPVEEIADASGTISYELLCGVTRRVIFDVC